MGQPAAQIDHVYNEVPYPLPRPVLWPTATPGVCSPWQARHKGKRTWLTQGRHLETFTWGRKAPYIIQKHGTAARSGFANSKRQHLAT